MVTSSLKWGNFSSNPLATRSMEGLKTTRHNPSEKRESRKKMATKA